MIINHNMNALNAHRNMVGNTSQAGKSMEKLSSGLRINRAGDDAAGLAISEKMRGQIRGLDQASRNAQDGISMIQTAEGALNETHSILQRMRELAVQAGNDTNTTEDRGQIQQEINQLTSEVNRISNTTEFNNQKLLKGNNDQSGNFEATLQIGANKGQALTIDIGIMNAEKLNISGTEKEEVMKGPTAIAATTTVTKNKKLTITIDGNPKDVISAAATTDSELSRADLLSAINNTLKENKVDAQVKLDKDNKVVISGKDATKVTKITNDAAELAGALAKADGDFKNGITDGTNNDLTGSALDVSNHTNAGIAVDKFEAALNTVSTERSKLGAFQNRLEHTINNLGTSSENLTAAESRIRDVDMAKEMMTFSKNNILQQAAQAMLAQANQQPQGVLQLLR